MDNRIAKEAYYLEIAAAISLRSTCIRKRYGAVIVKNDEIKATGYNGSPRGMVNCNAISRCIREERKIPSGERYEYCRAVHAEQNALLSIARQDAIDATLYLYGYDMVKGEEIKKPLPCMICNKMVINSGIAYVNANGILISRDELIQMDNEYFDKVVI